VIAVANLLPVFLLSRASAAAEKALQTERAQAVSDLQKAIRNTDIEALEKGTRFARRVNLGVDPAYQPILATAGEILGELRGNLKREHAASACWLLPADVDLDWPRGRSASAATVREDDTGTLQKENVRLKAEVEALKNELAEITAERDELRRRNQIVDI